MKWAMVWVIVGSTVLADLLQSFEMKRHSVAVEDLRPGRLAGMLRGLGSTRPSGAGSILHGNLFLRLYEAFVRGRLKLLCSRNSSERSAGDRAGAPGAAGKRHGDALGRRALCGLRSSAARNVSGLHVAILAVAAAAGLYQLLAIAAVLSHRRRPARPPIHNPPVSILKPVYGKDAGFYEAIRTHAIQQYPEFEILFGIRRTDDPARSEVERLMREFPSVAIRLILCTTPAPNLKVGR